MLELAGITALVIAIVALILAVVLIFKRAARSGLIFYVSLFLLLIAISYSIHAFIEIFGPRLGLSNELTGQLYAVSSVVASLFVFFSLIVIRIISRLLTRG